MANVKLVADINQRLAKGEPEEQIRAGLEKAGYTSLDIAGAFALLKLQASPRHYGQYVPNPVPPRPKRTTVVADLLLFGILLAAALIAYGIYAYAVQPYLAKTESTGFATASTTPLPPGDIPLAPLQTAPGVIYENPADEPQPTFAQLVEEKAASLFGQSSGGAPTPNQPGTVLRTTTITTVKSSSGTTVTTQTTQPDGTTTTSTN